MALAAPLLVEQPDARAEEVLLADPPPDDGVVVHHRERLDPVLDHPVGDLAQGLVGVGHEPVERRGPARPGDHHVAHAQRLERVGRVLAAHVDALARDLLGQDRPPQHQHAHHVRDGGGDQQRQQRVGVVGELHREDHGRERRSHDPRHRGGHAQQAPDRDRAAGEDGAEQPADRGAHQQQRREDAAAGARAERDRPDHELHDQQRGEGAQRHAAASSSDRLS